jgi:hypothetical protein
MVVVADVNVSVQDAGLDEFREAPKRENRTLNRSLTDPVASLLIVLA